MSGCGRRYLVILAAVAGGLAMCGVAVESPRKAAQAIRVDQGAIVVDGKLDDAAWAKAPVQTGFERLTSMANRDAVPGTMQTSFQVAWDAGTLYVGMRCKEPNIAGMKPYPAPEVWDGAMWANDCIELFVDPTGRRDSYYHFASGPNGAQYDAYWRNGQWTDYSTVWQSRAAVGEGEWTMEWAIPLAALHRAPSSAWSNTWVLSVCRTAPASSGNTMYSPTEGFHKIDQAGTLTGMPSAEAALPLAVECASFALEPDGAGGFRLLTRLPVHNHGTAPVKGMLSLEVAGAKPVSLEVELPAGQESVVSAPPVAGVRPGGITAVCRITDAGGVPRVIRRFDATVDYVAMSVRLTDPAYRGAVYAGQRSGMKRIKGVVELGMPLEQVADCMLHVEMTSPVSNEAPVTTELAVSNRLMAFRLPVDKLVIGEYRLTFELRRPGQAAPEASTELVMPSYPPAPAIEVRVDHEGNVIVDGRPVIVRGFYGSMSSRSPDYRLLPRSVNFMNSGADEMWTLADIKGLIDENAAKSNPPIDADMTNRIRSVVNSVRNSRNVIGYYLEEDCGGRGVGAAYLKKIYDILRVEDPYRIVMLTEAPDAAQLAACDVLHNRQWHTVVQSEDGVRRFGVPVDRIGEGIARAFGTPGKALWCGPQAFAYAEESGDARRRILTPMEQRYVMLTCLLRGARGFTCHTLWDYTDNLATRWAINSAFDELAWLDVFWRQTGNRVSVSNDNPRILVEARTADPAGNGTRHTTIVAVNVSDEAQDAALTVEGLKQASLRVLREGRFVALSDGTIRDRFEPASVHVYTTLEAEPDLEPAERVWQRLVDRAAAATASGNLLAQPGLKYRVTGSQFSMDGADPSTDRFKFVDGDEERSAWGGWNAGNECRIEFEKPVTLGRIRFVSLSLSGARLEARVDGGWVQLAAWANQPGCEFAWAGQAVETSVLRIVPDGVRMGDNGPAGPSIAELGLFAK